MTEAAVSGVSLFHEHPRSISLDVQRIRLCWIMIGHGSIRVLRSHCLINWASLRSQPNFYDFKTLSKLVLQKIEQANLYTVYPGSQWDAAISSTHVDIFLKIWFLFALTQDEFPIRYPAYKALISSGFSSPQLAQHQTYLNLLLWWIIEWREVCRPISDIRNIVILSSYHTVKKMKLRL